jgi:DNA repair protein RAD50
MVFCFNNLSSRSYVRDKGARLLEQCEEKVSQHEARIGELSAEIESVRATIAEIDKEINESGASLADLRENIRIRKLARDIEATVAQINSYDMEEAAKARRNFEAKYTSEKEKETQMQSKVLVSLFLSFWRNCD